MIILGIETSCDETGASIIESTSDSIKILSNSLSTSLNFHAKTGGIIPEKAAREQVKFILPVIQKCLDDAKIAKDKIDAIAVTTGPGLIGSLFVGVETAKTLSFVWNKPIIPVNHLYGHIYANWLSQSTDYRLPTTEKKKVEPVDKIKFPAIALIVSGGHTDLVFMKNQTSLEWLGGTRDDAAGECFDKCARLLGYQYPGGPKISELAKKGDPNAFNLPRPMLDSHDNDFSFSGLKTAFLYLTKKHFPVLRSKIPDSKAGWQQIVVEEQLTDKEKQVLYDLCASLEQAIVDTICIKVMRVMKKYQAKSLIISGGVAANEKLRKELKLRAKTLTIKPEIFVPEKSLCTDNAAMIAAAAAIYDSPTPWQNVSVNPELYFD